MEIFVHRDGRQFGPYSVEEVRARLANGTFEMSDNAWTEGMPEWDHLSSFAAFRDEANTAPPPLPSRPTATPATATRHHAFGPGLMNKRGLQALLAILAAVLVVILVGKCAVNMEQSMKEASRQGDQRAQQESAADQKHYTEMIAQRKVSIGMSDEQVVAAWGKPLRVNRTSNAEHTHEQWVYPRETYLYLDDGILTSVHESR